MTRHTLEFDQRIADWLELDPNLAPADVLSTVVAALPSIPQARRGLLAPRRFIDVMTSVRLAAAVAILAIAGLGAFAILGGGSNPPAASPTPAATARETPPTVTSGASGAAPTFPLTLGPTFTSSLHAISLSYPVGWDTRAATQPWTTADFPLFQDDSVDVMYDPILTDHMFVAVASQSHAGKTREAWATALATAEDGCEIEPMEWSGGSAWISRPCRLFYVAESDVGWAIRLYAPDVQPTDPDYGRLFEEILVTVELDYAATGG